MFGLKKCSLGGAVALAFCGLASQAFASADTLVLTPPLGWNSWNVFHENINEKQIQEIAAGTFSTKTSTKSRFRKLPTRWSNPV